MPFPNDRHRWNLHTARVRIRVNDHNRLADTEEDADEQRNPEVMAGTEVDRALVDCDEDRLRRPTFLIFSVTEFAYRSATFVLVPKYPNRCFGPSWTLGAS